MNQLTRRKVIKFFAGLTSLSFWITRVRAEGRSVLPQVFIIGDSISIGYTPFVQEALAGRAVVSRPPQNCNGTRMGVERLDDWVGDTKYDLIHFNFGLHDMKHVDPVTGKGSLNPHDPVQSEPEVYKSNLEVIVNRLKPTGAKLVFANTTSVPEISGLVLREPVRLMKYNRVAEKVMRRHRVPVNDLFEYSLSIVEAHQKPNDVHFTNEGYRLLGNRVAAAISDILGV